MKNNLLFAAIAICVLACISHISMVRANSGSHNLSDTGNNESNGSNEINGSNGSNGSKENGPSKPKIVAITQIVEHPSADQVRKGILDVLTEHGFVDGKNIIIHYENAQGNMGTAIQIANKFVSLSPDVIVPITTPSSQAVVSASKKTNIPVVFAAVTDPINAKLVTNMKHPGGNITGTTEFPPIEQQLQLIQKIIPNVKKVGVVFSPSEINSVKIVQLIKSAGNKQGIEIIEAPAMTSSEVPAATQSLVKNVQAIYVPLDNTVLSAMNGVLKEGFANKIPVFSSDPDSVPQGALASISYTQYEAGRLAGEMVIRIFNGEKPGSIPVSSPAKAKLTVNLESAKKLGIILPKEIIEEAIEKK